jgi:tRNA dimethylallyltransferase
MSTDMKNPPLIIFLGPTAVGKTALSLSLVSQFNGEIVSADSRLFYRGMDIGTAKPSPVELASVQHHLIDVAEVDQIWSLAKFKREAVKVIDDIHQRRKIPFLVGGTGQYLKAITEGWVIPELPANETMREILANWSGEIGAEGLYARLKVIDPVAADRMDPANLRRTIRALEVIFYSGRQFSALRQREPVPYRLLQIGLDRPRAELDDRIDRRVDAMIEAGLVEEVSGLLAEGYSPTLPSMSAIGYSQIAAYLAGEMTLNEAIEETKKVTRKFYRRQMTWFKRSDPEIHWFEMGKDPEKQIAELIQPFIFG